MQKSEQTQSEQGVSKGGSKMIITRVTKSFKERMKSAMANAGIKKESDLFRSALLNEVKRIEQGETGSEKESTQSAIKLLKKYL